MDASPGHSLHASPARRRPSFRLETATSARYLAFAEAAVPNIFISYRRDDTGGHAGRLANALQTRFGRSHAFIDVETMSGGVNFEDAIREWLADCQVALILIGPRWLSLTEADGTRRIDADGDTVALEVETALREPGVTVIPVLVEAASMPSTDDLPPKLQPLSKLNAFDLSTKRWDYDVRQIETFARRRDRWWWRLVFRTPRAVLRAAPVVILAVVAAVVAVLATGGGSASSHQSPAQHVAACERNHGMASASVARPPGTGETQLNQNQISPPINGEQFTFTQMTYASCTWPPGPGADPDGYRAMTATLTNGPGTTDASPNEYVTVIESKCKRVEVLYSLGKSGDEQLFRPFVARPNEIWEANVGNALTFALVARIGSSAQPRLELPFYPPTNSIVALTGAIQLQKLTCLA